MEVNMTRNECLENLLKGIFGSKGVNYEFSEGIYTITIKSGLYDKKKFNKSAAERCRKVFELSLLNFEPNFEIKSDFNREKMLNNCAEYFNKYGANTSDFFDKEKNSPILPRVFYTAINEYIIPVIYQEDGKAEDDISEEFKLAFSEICGLFQTFKTGHLEKFNIKSKEVLCIFDSEYKKSDLNFAVPSKRFGSYLSDLCYWLIPSIEITKPNIIKNSSRRSFEQLTKGYVPYHNHFNENDYFKRNSDFIILDEEHLIEKGYSYPLANIKLKTTSIPKDFYYVTYLDENNTRQFESQNDLEKYLENKVKSDLKKFFADEISEYYISLISSIEIFLEKLRSIDLTCFIKKNTTDIENYKKIMNHFDIDADKLLNHLIEYEGFDKEQAVCQAYGLLENLFFEFISQHHDTYEDLVYNLKQFNGIIIIDKHMRTIKTFVESDELAYMIELQNKLGILPFYGFKSMKNTSCTLGMGNHNNYSKNIFEWLKTTLIKYIEYYNENKFKDISVPPHTNKKRDDIIVMGRKNFFL